MPELVLFKRRWHMATDTLPVMMLLLCITHVVWFIPYATGYWSVESTGLIYDCPQATYLRVANYALFSCFGLAAITEAIICVLGLRGGPFETRKRRLVTPLLYFEMLLWVLLLGFTIYSTVIVYGGQVQQSCWTNNPCQYAADKLPVSCRKRGNEVVATLSPECQFIVDSEGTRPNDDGFSCWDLWVIHGLNWVAQVQTIFGQYEAAIEARYNMTFEEMEAMAEPPPGFDEFVDDLAAQFNATYLGSIENVKKLCGPSVWNTTWWKETLGINISDGEGMRNTGNMVVSSFDGQNFTTAASYNAFLEEHPNVFAYINNKLVDHIEESTNLTLKGSLHGNLEASADMPWTYCLSDECQEWTHAADACTEWAQILLLPPTQDKRGFFEVLVISSWVVLGVTSLVFFLCFNAFPSYDDEDSWEGTVKSLSSLCCMGGMMAESAQLSMGSEFTVSKEIARSLNLLFGGIDMDPTDRLLGIYLVSERQHRRREQDVRSALEDAGFTLGRVKSRFSAALHMLRSAGSSVGSALHPQGSQARSKPAGSMARPQPGLSYPACSGKLAGSDAEDGADAPAAVPLDQAAAAAGGATNGAANGTAHCTAAAEGATDKAANGAVPSRGPSGLLPSPFEAAAPRAPGAAAAPRPPGAAAGSSQRPSAELPGQGRLMLYQRSMLRLRSSITRQAPSAQRPQDQALAAVEEGRSGEQAAGAPSGEHASSSAEAETLLMGPSEAAQPGAGGGGGSLVCPGSPAGGGPSPELSWHWANKAIRVTSRFHPLLTPSGCAGGSHLADPPLSPQQAADIYAGKLEPVGFDTLREAQRISRFAVAAYGLQSVIWAKGQRPAMCLANANRLVKCLKKPLGLESKFRKRNFDTIIEMTGVAPSDLLYVSYANVAGGVLPYLIMLHRPSKSVVLSVRGTVSMEDLITDLLSNPVDVGDWVPAWVAQEAAARAAAGIAGDASGADLKAHIGIVSSATAILKDMEERGLLRELLLSKLLRTATLTGRNTQELVEDFLASYQSQAIPAVPQQQGPMARAPAAADAAPPAGGGATGSGAQAAAGVAASGGGGEGGEGEGEDGTAAPQFKAAEARLMRHLATLRKDREVQLPLDRAQTVLRSKLQLQGWKVVVTGHSLGAAVACMLGMQLRDRFTDLQCWAFNPPGGLLSWELSQIAQAYCTSIVVGKDLISRLSFNNSKRIVDEMVVSLARCARPKLRVALDVLLGRRKRAEATPATFCSFADIAPEALELVEGYYRTSHLHLQSADTTEMYPPGKIVFLRPFKGRRKNQTVWDAVWIDAATLISEGILVTPSMMQHHRLFVLGDAFKSIFADEAATQAAAQHEQGEEDVLGPLTIAQFAAP